MDDIAKETTLPAGQLLAMFNKSVRKIARRMRKVFETAAAEEIDGSLEAAKVRSAKKNKNRKKVKGGRMQTLAAEQAADANEAMIEMGSRSKGSGATSNALEGALGEFAEYMVPEELGAALQARGGKSVPSSISVKRTSVRPTWRVRSFRMSTHWVLGLIFWRGSAAAMELVRTFPVRPSAMAFGLRASCKLS